MPQGICESDVGLQILGCGVYIIRSRVKGLGSIAVDLAEL